MNKSVRELINGAACVLDLGASRGLRSTGVHRSFHRVDAEALRDDWCRVGQDIYDGIVKVGCGIEGHVEEE